MSRRAVTLSVGVVLLLILGILGLFLKVPYVELGPGPTFNTLGSVNGQKVIEISGRGVNQTSGHLNMTTVSVRDNVGLLAALQGWFAGDVAVVPRSSVFPPGQKQKEIDKENTQEFVQSQNSAETAALSELGYPTRVVVKQVASGSPSASKLQAGDVLNKVNGTAVDNFDELTKVLTSLTPGDVATVDFERNGKTGSTTITTTKAADRSGAALGITVAMEPVAPFTINFSLQNVGGPSAGLMFALGIIDKLGSKDLTHGKFIAGTGTINDKGNVGPIGGIGLKMIAARRAGATVFLVPRDNCAEAKGNKPSGLRLVKVNTLHDALSSLQQLQNGQNPPTC